MKTQREEFSSITKRLAWARANGRCEGMVPEQLKEYADAVWPWMEEARLARCNAPVDLGEFHYDHIIPYWMCRDSSLENCQILCRECHKQKTKHDVKDIAKSKRIADKRIKARKPKGRPLPGTKRSGLRKRMDGTVERR